MGRLFIQENFDQNVYHNTIQYAISGTENALEHLVAHLQFCDDCFFHWINCYRKPGIEIGIFTNIDDFYTLDANELYHGCPPSTCKHGKEFHDALVKNE
jgi:hypothetical protein